MESNLTPDPDFRIPDGQLSRHASCGCALFAYGETGKGPTFRYCELHRAAGELAKACKAAHKHWARLQSTILGLIDEGMITREHFPDDFAAIVLALANARKAGREIQKAIQKAEPPKEVKPEWFA